MPTSGCSSPPPTRPSWTAGKGSRRCSLRTGPRAPLVALDASGGLSTGRAAATRRGPSSPGSSWTSWSGWPRRPVRNRRSRPSGGGSRRWSAFAPRRSRSEALLGGDEGGVCTVAARAARMLEEAARTDRTSARRHPRCSSRPRRSTRRWAACGGTWTGSRRTWSDSRWWRSGSTASDASPGSTARTSRASPPGSRRSGVECARLEGRRERLAALEAERSAAEAHAWETARALRREREARRAAAGASDERRARTAGAARARPSPSSSRRGRAPRRRSRRGRVPLRGQPRRARLDPCRGWPPAGEASRLWLALKRTSMAQGGPEEAGTVVLDEADAGVSGARRGCRRPDGAGRGRRAPGALHHHLPQVAAARGRPPGGRKTSSRGRTWSSVRSLEDGSPRTRELARMMSGAIVTSEALAAAEALVRAARAAGPAPTVRTVSRARRVA